LKRRDRYGKFAGGTLKTTGEETRQGYPATTLGAHKDKQATDKAIKNAKNRGRSSLNWKFVQKGTFHIKQASGGLPFRKNAVKKMSIP